MLLCQAGLYIDEFQDIQRIGESFRRAWANVLKRKMRATFQRSSDVSFLFAGSPQHMMQTIFGSSGEALFNFGSFHALAPITDEEWHAGLSERFARDRTTVDDAALHMLIARGAGHPRATMLLAESAHMSSIVAGTRAISLDGAMIAYEECLRSELPRHEALVDRIRHIGPPALNRVALPIMATLVDGRQHIVYVEPTAHRFHGLGV